MTTILIALASGVLVLLAGSLPWGGLVALNFRAGTSVPWAVVPMTLYLWAYWSFLGGRWHAPALAAQRRSTLRANALPGRVWAAALAAGLLGFAALLALLAVTARLVPLPAGSPIATPATMPAATVVVLLVMQSIVAGVTEEAAFRGYMQSPIERQYGLGVAILINGAVGLLHAPNHPDGVLLMLPYYLAVSAVYGSLTWAVDSILPALVLHVAGDVVVLIRWWATGRPAWQRGEAAPPLVSEGGVDVDFVAAAVVLVALTCLTAWACASLRAWSRGARGSLR